VSPGLGPADPESRSPSSSMRDPEQAELSDLCAHNEHDPAGANNGRGGRSPHPSERADGDGFPTASNSSW
jgi:hypothetical protein